MVIIFSLWMQISTNLNLQMPIIEYNNDYPKFINKLIYQINLTIWDIRTLGWLVGLTNKWRMFSPALPSSNWHMRFWSIHQSGKKILLPISNQMSRNFWQRNIIDFREGKFTWNIAGKTSFLNEYVRYLCRVHEIPQDPITTIRIDLYWQEIFTLRKAQKEGSYQSQLRLYEGKMGNYSCSEFSKDS